MKIKTGDLEYRGFHVLLRCTAREFYERKHFYDALFVYSDLEFDDLKYITSKRNHIILYKDILTSHFGKRINPLKKNLNLE